MKKLKIAFVATYNAKDINNWSGLGFYISKTLEKYIGEVIYLGNLGEAKFNKNIFKKIWYKKVKGLIYDTSRLDIAKRYAKYLENQINGKDFDIIFSPGTIPIANLDTKIPIITWTDANFQIMIDYYFKNLCSETIKIGNQVEKNALVRSSLAIFSSDWAANSAIDFYKIEPNKVKVIPFGANMDNIPEVNELNCKMNKVIKLLFVGKDWDRKGGSIAFDTLKSLNKQGIKSTLTIIGCVPPKRFTDKNLRIIPFINKNNEKERNELKNHYINSDFFILPTRKDCTPVVFCEAAAYGLPVLSTRTGGVETIVKDDINGYLFAPEAGGKQFAEKIIEVRDNGKYEDISKSSRKRFEEVLNWDSLGKKLKFEIEKIL